MSTRILTILAAAAGLALGAPGTAPSAMAQDSEGEPAKEASPTQNYSDEELETYAVAMARIEEINRDYSARLNTTQDPEQQQRIRMEARQEMVSAVRDSGITVERFNEISRAAQSDDELQDDIDQRVKEAME